MEVFTVKNLSFCYPWQENASLDELSFSVERGQFVAIIGASGSGKTTLMRQFKTVLAPHGRCSGELLFCGTPLAHVGLREQSAKIGFLLQSPENQLVTDKVWHELAFGLESLGCDTKVIRARVAEMASFFGIESWFYKNVTELSGGQKQILNLAAIMAMQPEVLILDEPTSWLDPIAAGEFISVLGKINRELGTTVILTEHRLDEVFPLCDRVLVMDKGKIVCEGTPRETGEWLRDTGHSMFFSMPVPMRVYAAIPNELVCPTTVRDGRTWLDDYAAIHTIGAVPEHEAAKQSDKTAIALDGVWFRYEKALTDVAKGLSLKVNKGEFLAIVGGNGAGKTTALSIIAGHNKPYRGKVQTNGSLVLLPQNPQTLFAKKTVFEDLKEMRRRTDDGFEGRLAYVSRICRLEDLLKRHPYDLSGGEMQRAALAKVLLAEPEILLLDEPTKGMDAEFKQELAEILRSLTARGITIVMVSHDLEFCAENAQRSTLIFDGRVVSEGTPREFFGENSFYTTAANRMARQLLPEAVTAVDIIHACGGNIPINSTLRSGKEQSDKTTVENPQKNAEMPPTDMHMQKRGLPKRAIVAAIMILFAIPLTVLFGIYFLDDRKYAFISLLVMLEAMLPFFLVFERRKPQARELVVIAVLCALGVAGRAAFFMLPQFKPVMAIVIISGVAFGGETGFLVGAITMLASNVMFGQGPWTPWQMFAMGIIGASAGLLFRKDMLPRTALPLSSFGFVCALIVYGGIMNTANVLMYQISPTKAMLLASYASGLPFDLIHATATLLFLLLISKPMLEKLDRVKAKYGLIG